MGTRGGDIGARRTLASSSQRPHPSLHARPCASRPRTTDRPPATEIAEYYRKELGKMGWEEDKEASYIMAEEGVGGLTFAFEPTSVLWRNP